MARVDVGTLENVFENDLQNVPKTISQEKAVEVAGRLRDNVLSRGNWRNRKPGVQKESATILAFSVFRTQSKVQSGKCFS
jgi:hypothetical protein